jgi:hypothetical protein
LIKEVVVLLQERSLQNITNYFIVSLAVADLLVAGVVMPFYTYTMVRHEYSVKGKFKEMLFSSISSITLTTYVVP